MTRKIYAGISRTLIIFCATILFFQNCTSETYDPKVLEDPELFQEAMQNLTDIIVYDIFSPPVASRVYVYPTVAAYEVMRLGKPEKFQTLAGQLSGLTALPPNTNPDVDFNLAALYAFNALGKELIFSEDKMTAFQESFDQQLDTKGIPTRVRKASKEFAGVAVDHIHQWYKQDNYDQTRTAPKYTIQEGCRN